MTFSMRSKEAPSVNRTVSAPEYISFPPSFVASKSVPLSKLLSV